MVGHNKLEYDAKHDSISIHGFRYEKPLFQASCGAVMTAGAVYEVTDYFLRSVSHVPLALSIVTATVLAGVVGYFTFMKTRYQSYFATTESDVSDEWKHVLHEAHQRQEPSLDKEVWRQLYSDSNVMRQHA